MTEERERQIPRINPGVQTEARGGGAVSEGKAGLLAQ